MPCFVFAAGDRGQWRSFLSLSEAEVWGSKRWLDGLDGHFCRGPELSGLASNATDLGEASSVHGRYRVGSEPRTLAL